MIAIAAGSSIVVIEVEDGIEIIEVISATTTVVAVISIEITAVVVSIVIARIAKVAEGVEEAEAAIGLEDIKDRRLVSCLFFFSFVEFNFDYLFFTWEFKFSLLL